MQNIKKIIGNHKELCIFLGLCIIFYFLFFYDIGSYALMDVDETRYVSMAKNMYKSKNFLTLYLNNEFFFEKPPLYFWGECLSFEMFGNINEFTARFSVAMYGTLSAFLTYFVGKKFVSIKYGIISSLILATSLEFLILSKFAILDILLATCIWFSLGFGMITQFCSENNKKYFWWLFYIMSAMAVLAKGIPGFVIPFGSMFFITIINKKFKEIFKPQFIIPGIILFFAITLPWHIIMLKIHNPLFFDEYIIKHHLSRFIGSETLGRQQPFYFYILTLIWGFFPWTPSCFSVFIKKIIKKEFSIRNISTEKKYILFNSIIVAMIFLFFSTSKTKLITYILPIYPSLACIGGYIWYKYITKGENANIINKVTYTISVVFLLASIVAMFSWLFLPKQLNNDISTTKYICIILLFVFGASSILFTKLKKYLYVFIMHVLFIVCLSAFCTDNFFNIDYKFGQNDLIEFAKYSKENNKTLTCYQFSHKYSLIYYSDKIVEYGLNYKIKDLIDSLNKANNLVIIPKKKITKEIQNINYKVIKEGRKYVLISK